LTAVRREGKAGAYGIQDTGDEFVDHLDGSLTNVMGLPMELIQRLLAGIL
jgi:septum formation protein